MLNTQVEIVVGLISKRNTTLFYLLFFLFTGYTSLAQKTIFSEVNALFKSNNSNSYQIFEPAKEKGNEYVIDASQLESLLLEKKQLISLDFSYGGLPLTLMLRKADLFSGDDHSYTKDGLVLPPLDVLCYRGFVQNEVKSLVSITIVENKINMWVSSPNYNFELHEIEGRYKAIESSVEPLQNVSCHTSEEGAVDLSRPNVNNRNQANCIDLFIEVDYEMYLINNSDVQEVQVWATSVLNNLATIFENESVPIYVRQFTYNFTPDNYTTDLIASLDEFVTSNSGGIGGAIGFLMSGQAMGGGISQGIGGYCNGLTDYPGPFAIAGDMTIPSINYPSYSYNVMIMAHEIGHVMGLRHTHACVWNGNNTQIDDCGNVYADQNGNTPEGSLCYDSNNPILPGMNGTIMSNCHLSNGTAINFAEGFGTQPGAVLYQNFINAPCALGINCRTVTPINDDCANAIPLQVNNMCDLLPYDNRLATSSGVTPGFSCGSTGSTIDVWFTVEIPSSGNISIETDQVPSGLLDMVVQTYSGACGNLVQLDCDDNSGNGNHALINLTGRTPGEVIFVRIIDSGSNNSGDFGLCAYDVSVACHPEFDALIGFYTDMNGPMWINKSGWEDGVNNTDCDICNWYGVVCNSYGRVVELNLPSNNLSGALSNSLLQLTHLEKINFFSNGINNSIPDFLKDIALLNNVDLGSNQLTGSIPPLLSTSPNLITLYLDNNQLTGVLPDVLSLAPISNLWLNDNDLSGCIPSTYFDFCARGAVVNLNNNAQLPFGGNYMVFCADSLGSDIDLDGFCGGSQDCSDTDPNTYPGAPEICDGIDNNCDTLIDEGLSGVINNWVGMTDDWNDVSNWSAGVVPRSCHDVFIEPAIMDSAVIYALTDAIAGSVTIGTNGILHVQNFSTLNINENGGVVNNGLLSLFGDMTIHYPNVSASFINNNHIQVGSSGVLTLQESNQMGLVNNINGVIDNEGSITLDSMATSNGIGIENFGVINNDNLIILQSILGVDVVQRNGAVINNSSDGTIEAK